MNSSDLGCFNYKNENFSLACCLGQIDVRINASLIPDSSEIDDFYSDFLKVADSEKLTEKIIAYRNSTVFLPILTESSWITVFSSSNDGSCISSYLNNLKTALVVLNFLYDYWDSNKYFRYSLEEKSSLFNSIFDSRCLKWSIDLENVSFANLLIDGFEFSQLGDNEDGITEMFRTLVEKNVGSNHFDKRYLYHSLSEALFCSNTLSKSYYSNKCLGYHYFAGNGNVDFNDVNFAGFAYCNLFNESGFYFPCYEGHIDLSVDLSEFDVEKLAYSFGDNDRFFAVSLVTKRAVRDLFNCYEYFDSDDDFRKFYASLDNESDFGNRLKFIFASNDAKIRPWSYLNSGEYEDNLNKLRYNSNITHYDEMFLRGIIFQAHKLGKNELAADLLCFVKDLTNNRFRMGLGYDDTDALWFALKNDVPISLAFSLSGLDYDDFVGR